MKIEKYVLYQKTRPGKDLPGLYYEVFYSVLIASRAERFMALLAGK